MLSWLTWMSTKAALSQTKSMTRLEKLQVEGCSMMAGMVCGGVRAIRGTGVDWRLRHFRGLSFYSVFIS